MSARKLSKPRMCVLSVKRTCWRKDSLCLTAGVHKGLAPVGFEWELQTVVVLEQVCFREM